MCVQLDPCKAILVGEFTTLSTSIIAYTQLKLMDMA